MIEDRNGTHCESFGGKHIESSIESIFLCVFNFGKLLKTGDLSSFRCSIGEIQQ